MGNLLSSGYDADLVEGADLGGQASVNAENLAVDDGGEGEKVKDLATGLPYGSVAVLCLALFVETIDLSDLSRFVVATD